MTHLYRIVSVDDSYQDTGKVFVKVQVTGKAKTFDRPVSELYHREWLESFSREDVAHIAALYTAEHTKNLDLIKRFPIKNHSIKSSVIIVGILFTAFLILSNLTAFKLATLGPIVFPAGLIFFPLTYVFDDILTEVYGFKISRRIIWLALLANTIVFIGTWCTIYLNPSPDWHNQEAYATVYHATFRVFIASTISYFFGEFANSIILAKLKVFTSGRYFGLRAITSTIAGVGIDTVLFIHIAFLFTMPYSHLWKIIGMMYSLKVIYECVALPITYKVTNYLKQKDNVDYYDFKTKFNPFSLEV
jgi:queuosine precursor transporter